MFGFPKLRFETPTKEAGEVHAIPAAAKERVRETPKVYQVWKERTSGSELRLNKHNAEDGTFNSEFISGDKKGVMYFHQSAEDIADKFDKVRDLSSEEVSAYQGYEAQIQEKVGEQRRKRAAEAMESHYELSKPALGSVPTAAPDAETAPVRNERESMRDTLYKLEVKFRGLQDEFEAAVQSVTENIEKLHTASDAAALAPDLEKMAATLKDIAERQNTLSDADDELSKNLGASASQSVLGEALEKRQGAIRDLENLLSEAKALDKNAQGLLEEPVEVEVSKPDLEATDAAFKPVEERVAQSSEASPAPMEQKKVPPTKDTSEKKRSSQALAKLKESLESVEEEFSKAAGQGDIEDTHFLSKARFEERQLKRLNKEDERSFEAELAGVRQRIDALITNKRREREERAQEKALKPRVHLLRNMPPSGIKVEEAEFEEEQPTEAATQVPAQNPQENIVPFPVEKKEAPAPSEENKANPAQVELDRKLKDLEAKMGESEWRLFWDHVKGIQEDYARYQETAKELDLGNKRRPMPSSVLNKWVREIAKEIDGLIAPSIPDANMRGLLAKELAVRTTQTTAL